MGTAISSVGHYLPPMVERLGVTRPIAVEPVGPATLAARAAEPALARAGLNGADIDFIIFATATPDVAFPGSGVFLQHQLGCGTIGALDIRAQCAGFLFGLSIADQFFRAGAYERILLAGGEVHWAGLDESAEGAATARLFGDGAGVMILGAAGSASVLAVDIHSDGRHYRDFWCEYPASRQFPRRITAENFAAKGHFPRLDVDAVRAFGADAIETSIRDVLARCELRPADIDRFIVSHAFPDVADLAVARLGVEATRTTVPSRRYGHVMAAALPVALSEDLAAGRIGAGARICLAAAGAGFSWGAAVVQW